MMVKIFLTTAAAMACLLQVHHYGVDAFHAFPLTSRSAAITSRLQYTNEHDDTSSASPSKINRVNDVQATMMARVGFDAWDNSKSPHVANGYTTLDQGNILWQYAYHGNWHEVYTRVCSNPSEAKYIRDNGWTPLHLLVAGNGNPAPVKVVRAVYNAFPGALEMRTNDYNRTPLDIARRWNQPQDVIDFLSNPEKFSLNGKGTNGHHDPNEPIHVDDDIFLIIDDTVSTTSAEGGGAHQQPTPRSTYSARSAKPLSADAIVVTDLQSQHNDFIQDHSNEMQPIRVNNGSDQSTSSTSDYKTKIMQLELENHRLKETEKQMQLKVQEADQRLKRVEDDMSQTFQAEIDRRVGEVQQSLKAEVDNLKNSEDTRIANLAKDLESSKATEKQMRSAVVAANAEVESLRRDLDNSKEAENKMRNKIAAANAELDEAQQRLSGLEDQMEKLQQRSQAETESLKRSDDTRITDMGRELSRLKAVEEQMRNALLSANTEVQESEHRLKETEKQMRNAVQSANAEVREAQNQLESLEDGVQSDKTIIMSLQRDLEKSRETEEQMRSAVVSANTEFRVAHKRWEGLENQVVTLAGSERSLLTQVERLRAQLKQKEL